MDLVSEPSASAASPPASVAFGRFQMMPHGRELLADGQSIKLGGRAFDVLMALIEARGAVVSKNALMDRVWPGRIVEENNLQTQVSALRAAFGADRALIRTVSGRGYQFTGEVRILPQSPGERESPGERAGALAAAAKPGAVPSPTNLPEPVAELIGRNDELCENLNLAAARRLVTLTGPGGIGKTRLALAVAHRRLPHFPDGVWFAELAPLTDPNLVPVVVAAAVGLEVAAPTVSAERVATALGGKRLLLVLDNCEHVVGAAAVLAEALLRANPAAHVIATSREPLRVEGEWVYQVPPLAVPAEGADDEDDLLQYGAVRLFLDRARAAAPCFAPDRRRTAMIGTICRQLDGIPLAIELAAARSATLGVEELAARLEDRFAVLTCGRRTALPRHQTLRATFDWSHGLLDESERVVLRRLAIFAGPFSLEAASEVIARREIGRSDVAEGLCHLVAKSLVAVRVDRTNARYRLLDTTRAYAREKLAESGEQEQLARRHAEYYRDLFERAETEWDVRPTAEWLADYGHHIDDLRAALDWAFSPDGDASIGVALTAAAVPLWTYLSLMEECRGRAEQALACLGAETPPDACREMKLRAALGASLIYTRSASTAEIGAAWTKALALAESLDDAKYQLRSLWGLWFFHTASGQHRHALALAQRYHSLAANRSDPDDRLVGERMVGVSQHYLGDLADARRHLECVVADLAISDHRSHIIRFQIDLRMPARVFLARILWLQGFPDQAMFTAESSIEDARAANHAVSLCYALALGACPIALVVGDLAAAERYVDMLLDHSTRHALTHWRAFGVCHQGALAIKRGDVATGSSLLRVGFDQLGDVMPALRFIFLLMPEVLNHAGQVAEAVTALNEALERPEYTEEGWLIAELLRTKGELLLLQGGHDGATAAENRFRQALDRAREQGALSVELRAATSLARLLWAQDRSREASVVLQPVYDRFTEGFDTADLKAAKALLSSVRSASATRVASAPGTAATVNGPLQSVAKSLSGISYQSAPSGGGSR